MKLLVFFGFYSWNELQRKLLILSDYLEVPQISSTRKETGHFVSKGETCLLKIPYGV